MLFYAMLLDWVSLSGSLPVGRRAGETVQLQAQRGFVKVTRNTRINTHVCIHVHTHTHTHTHKHTCARASKQRGDRQSHSVRGKNTEIKRCVLVVFNLAC